MSSKIRHAKLDATITSASFELVKGLLNGRSLCPQLRSLTLDPWVIMTPATTSWMELGNSIGAPTLRRIQIDHHLPDADADLDAMLTAVAINAPNVQERGEGRRRR